METKKYFFFKSMSDEEIVLILKEVCFRSVKTDEVIIKEKWWFKDIYIFIKMWM